MTQAARLLFQNASVLDAERGELIPDRYVLVEGEHILEVGGPDVRATDADRIDLKVLEHASIRSSLINNKEYICAETLTANLDFVDRLDGEDSVNVEVDDEIQTRISIKKHNSVGLN